MTCLTAIALRRYVRQWLSFAASGRAMARLGRAWCRIGWARFCMELRGHGLVPYGEGYAMQRHSRATRGYGRAKNSRAMAWLGLVSRGRSDVQ